ncbi:uncharacterized protein I206_102871 [Kwoniella pini CBS 10737]|uniref:LIM zinc-binding domain-containing protein n=1 Tax=Kwoniella pini CBS 10737 TaxID=1296096 RepID=A0A1B9I6J0_9TREE|nr:uncharacterized protein I206_03221 [Kwoniella pini CBS 10737]OCF51155.1 hypothetical protein I206_03221 [Kwoniella pini CBS 10737]
MQYNGLPPQPGPSHYISQHGSLPPQPLPNPHDQSYESGPSRPAYQSDHNQYNAGYHQPSPPMSNGYHHLDHHGSQQPYQFPPQSAGPSSRFPSYPQPVPGVEAVPSPTPKAAYEAPVFQTFQERRRAKEIALRAQMGEISSPAIPHALTPPLSGYHRPQQHQQPTDHHRSLSPATHPSPVTLAMMGQRSSSTGPPLPPPARSQSPAPQPIAMQDSSSYRRNSINGQSRPLPSPRALPILSTTPGSTPSHSGTSSPHTPIRNSMPPPPIPSAIQANLERSDTLSSVKSLDRTGFSSSPVKRALPKPPVGVNSSRSLDRGIPSSAETATGLADSFKRKVDRRQPSVVDEGNEDVLVNGISEMSIGQTGSRLPSIPSIRTPSPGPTLPVIVTPASVVDHRSPAKFSPLPAINLASSDTSSVATTDDEADTHDLSQITPKAKRNNENPSSPGIQFSGLPMISVSTSDSADVPSNGEISIAIPTINFGEAPLINAPSMPAPTATPSSSRPQRTRVQLDGSAIICSGCNNAIIGRIVNAMNQRWHPQCFGCAECGELLEHVSSYEWEGKAYCHLDFHDKFAYRCHHCQTPIVDARFVTLNDPILGQRYYHELHFFCSECGDPFLDPSKSSAPGTEKSRDKGDEEEENETSAFVIQKGHPYCEKCHLKLHKPKCKSCNLPIPDLAINAMGAKWHKECFICTQCKHEFANNLFFPKDGQAFCTSCYESIIASA